MCNTLITYVSLLCGMVWCYAIVDITKINYPWPFLSKWNYPNFNILLSMIEISYLIILKLIILELHVKRKLVSTWFKMNKVINLHDFMMNLIGNFNFIIRDWWNIPFMWSLQPQDYVIVSHQKVITHFLCLFLSTYMFSCSE